MACQEADYARRTLATPFDWWVRTVVDALLPSSMGRRVPQLDVDALPDHLKRDLGFLDGREPRKGQNF
ncbi:MAG TPA: hypothetical protein VLZ56_00675 [Mycoplana sp.]|nr:hypothetical protein [Mycoplana sp.]